MTKRPNFLFFMTDQHRSDWLGCYGHPVVRTPNIDAIASKGTLFEQFFVATPVCMPNRASFLTGRYPSLHGLRYNGCVLPTSANTFVDVLRAGGYKTASIGKSHLQPITNMEPMEPSTFETGDIAEAWKSDNNSYRNEAPDQFGTEGRFAIETPYYGFDHVDLVTGHGLKAGGHYMQWLREQTSDWKQFLDPKNQQPHNYGLAQACRTIMPEELYHTSYIREQAKNNIRENAQSDEPFFSFVSFPDPHHPFNPPGKYWDMYSPDQFELGPRYEDHKNPPLPLKAAKALFEKGERPPLIFFEAMEEEQHIKEAMALTAGMISMIDDAVGEVIETLKESGQYDNTVIIFNTDHGDYLGDFDLLYKGAWPKRSITQVPCIWSDPKARKEHRSGTLASTIDLSASIIERAGLKPYFGIQGKSLLQNLSGSNELRESLLIEYNDSITLSGFDTPARVRTLLTYEWHLTLYGGENWGELYNRKTDPDELNNLWDSSEYRDTKYELIEELSHHLIAQMDESPKATLMA